MRQVTIHVYESEEGGYKYDIFDCAPMEVEDDYQEELDGGHHTGPYLKDAITSAADMAIEAMKQSKKTSNMANSFDPTICPSSLDEYGEPMTEGETAHKWDESAEPITCAECGTTKD